MISESDWDWEGMAILEEFCFEVFGSYRFRH